MKKWLAIVDDWEKLERYAERLAPWYEVLEAPFGSVGIEMARSHAAEIDQVLVDLVLEDMTEWEAHRELRSHPSTAALPATFMIEPGMALPPGWNAGIDRSVQRPYDFTKWLGSLMADTVLRFWFGQTAAERAEPNMELWFGGTPEIDQRIRVAFERWVEAAAAGRFEAWREDPRGLLALILLLDQFSLNIHRDQPSSFEQSAQAIPLSLQAIERGWDREATMLERVFLYLPLEHAEDLALQEKSVECFRKLVADASDREREQAEVFLDYAIKHWEVVKRFGRFPDRNPVFGREDTREEAEYMAAGGPPF